MSNVLKIKHSILDNFIGDGSTKTFILSGQPVSIQSVKVNDEDVTYTINNNYITFIDQIPTNKAKISVNYIGWSALPTIPGRDGKSAYEYALAGGYNKTEKEFYSAIGNVANKQDMITANSVLKADGKGVVSNAIPGTDYVVPEGNIATATKLAESKNIVIGNATKSFDGSSNISYTLDEIGAARLENGKVPDSQLKMLTSNMTYYISNSGNDTTGEEGNINKPFATISYVITNKIPKNLNSMQVSIIIFDGTYNEKINMNGFINGFIYFYGFNKESSNINITSIFAYNCRCRIQLENLTFTGSVSTDYNASVYATDNCFLEIHKCKFNNTTNIDSVYGLTSDRCSKILVRDSVFNNYFIAVNANLMAEVTVYRCSGNNQYSYRASTSDIRLFENTLTYEIEEIQQRNGSLIIQ